MKLKSLFISPMLVFISAIFLMNISNAQDLKEASQVYRIPKSSGKLFINIPGAVVEAYDGKEIILSFSTLNLEENENEEKNLSVINGLAMGATVTIAGPSFVRTGEAERIKGLMRISETGVMDNTNFGVNVLDEGGVTKITQVTKRDFKPLLIKVPKGIKITYSYNDAPNAKKIIFRNIDSELEVNVSYNSIELNNVTGPLTVKTIYGNLEAIIENAFKTPISLISVYGFIDLSIPTTSKLTLSTKSDWGDTFVSPDFKLELEKNDLNANPSGWSNQQIKSKLNGGGGEVSLKSSYGRIYVRSKK